MPNKQIQSLTVEGVTYDIVDNTSGYINAQYIENKTDYSIPVSRVGEIVVGETAIGTDSTNFPTSKAVVDYVDERVVQEIDAIDVGVTGVKVNGTSLSVVDGAVNIPVVSENHAGLMTAEYMENIFNSIPISTSQLINDSGFVTSDEEVKQEVVSSLATGYYAILFSVSNSTSTITSYTYKDSSFFYRPATRRLSVGNIQVGDVSQPGTITFGNISFTAPTTTTTNTITLPNETGTVALTSDITDEKLKVNATNDTNTYYPILTTTSTDAQTKVRHVGLQYNIGTNATLTIGYNSFSGPISGRLQLTNSNYYTTIQPSNNGKSNTITLPNKSGTVALLDDIPTVPTNISSFTNDSGYLTSSDIASVMTYKGTKANYAALPASGNTIGDVWHLTDTGAEWAWDGSTWQELGTAIDTSSFLTSESDPVFTASPAHGIAASDITNWNGKTTVSIVRW